MLGIKKLDSRNRANLLLDLTESLALERIEVLGLFFRAEGCSLVRLRVRIVQVFGNFCFLSLFCVLIRGLLLHICLVLFLKANFFRDLVSVESLTESLLRRFF